MTRLSLIYISASVSRICLLVLYRFLFVLGVILFDLNNIYPVLLHTFWLLSTLCLEPLVCEEISPFWPLWARLCLISTSGTSSFFILSYCYILLTCFTSFWDTHLTLRAIPLKSSNTPKTSRPCPPTHFLSILDFVFGTYLFLEKTPIWPCLDTP